MLYSHPHLNLQIMNIDFRELGVVITNDTSKAELEKLMAVHPQIKKVVEETLKLENNVKATK